ncbi:MAG TPA: patatin-like phospholipase family protein [Gemmataceae bacterium]|nr:patatin-like phospholipase family protein [Gemmataceae bacterium]
MSPAKPPGYLPAFCLHFLLPNTLLAILALVAGGLGAEYGVTYLVWHDEPVKQFWVGFALALVSLEALYIGFLLWGKKAGRPDRVDKLPRLAERINSGLFAHYCLWVVGQLAVLVVVVAGLVLVVQKVDQYAQGTPEPLAPDTFDSGDVAPPRPSYGPWLPLGMAAAAVVLFAGGWVAKQAIRLVSAPTADGPTRKLMTWLVDAADDHPHGPTRGGLLLALWSARTHGSRLRRLWVAAFNQTLCLSVGVVFAAVWELSHLSVAVGVAGAMLFALVAVRARWLSDGRAFRAFLLVLGCLSYFVVTWLGSRPWCGWPGAFTVAVYLVAVLAVGVRYAFPGPTAHLLRSTNDRIIDPALCRKYPFHGVAVVFFLFGVGTLFVLPMAFSDVRSPMVLGCFLAFMALALYGFVAYVVDDALPYLAPLLLVMVVLSGMPQYKMQFPALDYAARSADGEPALLDLEAQVALDASRLDDFGQAVEREMAGPDVAFIAGGAAPGVVALSEPSRRLWARVEDENRILPGKDLRPEAVVSNRGPLMPLSEVAFRSVPTDLGTITTLVKRAGRTGWETRPTSPAARKKPMVIVVASGGGIRAAAWTFLVLSELEARFAEEGIPFPYHVRLITGASGGMFGAAYYVRSLRPPGEMTWGDDRQTEMTGPGGRFDKLTQDWLTPIVERMVTNDVPGFLSPFPTPTDRGVALEQAWSRGLDGELDVTFEQLAEREKAGWCPSLAFSPMMVEDGRRLLISNLDLRYPASNDGHQLGYDDGPKALADLNRNYSHEALELFRLFPKARGRFPLSTAVRMSASFPYFSPAVPLPTKPRRRVVDAGYFDNYGVSLASAFLFSKKHQDWFRDNVSKIVLIQIRDGQSEDERQLKEVPDGVRRQKGVGSVTSRALEELTSPLEGLTNGRVGTTSFRNDGLLELLSTYFEQARGEPGSGKVPQANRYFTVVSFEFPGHVALSWHLSEGERAQIRRPFTDPDWDKAAELQSKIAALLEWWKADVYEPPADELRTKTNVAGAVR